MGLFDFMDERKYCTIVRNFLTIFYAYKLTQTKCFRIVNCFCLHKDDDFIVFKEWYAKISIKNITIINEFNS